MNNKTIAVFLALAVVGGAFYYMDMKKPGPEPVSGVAAIVSRVAASELGVEERDIKVESTFPREWSDSCLGLGRADESCLQVITPGYEVIFKVSGETLVYRTDTSGSVVRRQ